MNKGWMYYVEHVIYYAMIFFILRQWLVPVMELTKTGHFELFSYFILLCLIISILRLPLLLSWAIKITYISWFIITVYSEFAFMTKQGIDFLKSEISYNVSTLLKAEWAYVSDPFRTVLFFVLIWMLVYLIQHWITVRYTIFYFFVLTVFFIATLDTFSEYDGRAAIVQIVVLGLLMTAMLFLKRLVMTTGKVVEWQRLVLYLMPVALLIGLFSLAAFVMPKAAPQWPDPVPYLKGIAGQGGSGSQSTVGYSENDSVLGGPFSADDELVFTVKSRTKQYWRIETKEIYTSQGWETMEPASFTNYSWGEQIWHSGTMGDVTEQEPDRAIIQSEAEYNFLLQPYGFMAVEAPNADVYIRKDEMTEKLTVFPDQIIPQYEITYSEPSYSYTALKESRVMPSVEDGGMYLQIPETMPIRVRDLAVEITDRYESSYDKARAIQTYFSRSGFRYETRNVPIPEEGQDYVDQFLFETKYGYCDNFSTAMVMMLRSIDIPARWVKGFTSGKEVRSDQENYRMYEVTNNNAHSWVEAYIDGVGWMPFEPTIGYSSPVDINYDLTAEDTEDEQLLTEQEEEKKEQQQRKEKEQAAAAKPKAETQPMPPFVKWIGLGLLGALVIAAVLLAIFRRKWLPKMYVKMQSRVEMDVESFEKSYERLLKQLAYAGLKRQPNQTLQSFANQVDRYYDTDHMKRLTDAYERVIYSGQAAEINFDEMKESWEYLINRTSS